MPNRDGTGPNGEGPKTGRQLGKCEGTAPQDLRRGFGRGCGRIPRRFRDRINE